MLRHYIHTRKCSICGVIGHTKTTHHFDDERRKLYDQMQSERKSKAKCSICGQIGHKRNWHLQGQITEKICIKCKRILPADQFSTFKIMHREGGMIYNYLRPYCRECDKRRQDETNRVYAPIGIQRRRDEAKTLDGKLHQLMIQIRGRAVRKNLECNIDEFYLRQLYNEQEGKCFYSGIQMVAGVLEHMNKEHIMNPFIISADRKNPALGYIKGNVSLTCVGINFMKHELDEKDFLSFCRAIANKHPE